jgi:hypothetical protein
MLYLLRTARALLQSLSLRHGSSLASLSSPRFVRLQSASLGLVHRTFARSFDWLGCSSPRSRSTGTCTVGRSATVLQAAQACKTSFTFSLERCSLLEYNRAAVVRSPRIRLIVADDGNHPPSSLGVVLLVVDRRGPVVLVGVVPVLRSLSASSGRCETIDRSFVRCRPQVEIKAPLL